MATDETHKRRIVRVVTSEGNASVLRPIGPKKLAQGPTTTECPRPAEPYGEYETIYTREDLEEAERSAAWSDCGKHGNPRRTRRENLMALEHVRHIRHQLKQRGLLK